MNKKLLFALFCALTLNLYAVEFSPMLVGLNLDNIAINQKLILQQMQKNKYARIACATTAVATTAVVAWWLWQGTAASAVQTLSATQKINETHAATKLNTQRLANISNKLESVNDEALKALKEQYAELEKNQAKKGSVLNAANFFTSYGRHLIDTALITFGVHQLTGSTNFALRPVFKAWNNVFHDRNLQWYLTDKTHIKKELTELETLAEELVTAENDQERSTILCSMVHIEHGLIAEFEKLIGFMYYKHDFYKSQYPFAANGMKMMTQNMVNEVSFFVASAQDILNTQSRHGECLKLIKNFNKKINAHKRGFMMYEEFPEESIL